MHNFLVHLLSEQVHFYLYTLCNELFVKKGRLPPHKRTHVACGHAGSHCEMTLNAKELVFGLLVSNLRMCYVENKNCFSWGEGWVSN